MISLRSVFVLLLPLVVYLLFSFELCHAIQPTVKVGFVADFSSVSKAYSQNAYMAAEMAIDELNAGGGLLDSKIQLIRRDGGNDPERHYQHVLDLVENENVVAVFGGASSPCVLKASEAALEKHVPYLISIGNSQSIVVEHGHDFVFLFEPNNQMESLGFSIFATLMPWRRYAWIGPDYSWGRNVLGQFKQNFESIGAPIEWAAEAWHPLGNTDFKQQIKLVEEAEPDALVVATWGEDLRNLLLAAKGTDLFSKVATFGWFSLIPGESREFIPEGIWKISRGPFIYLSDKYPQTKQFVQDFNQRYKTYPLDFTICCYDSFLAWQKAVEKSGSFDPATIAETLGGLSFLSLRGQSSIRSVDGQMKAPTFFGRLVYRSDYPFAIMTSVMEIPAEKTWLSEEAVVQRRNLKPDAKNLDE